MAILAKGLNLVKDGEAIEVKKPWGRELWLSSDQDPDCEKPVPYALKVIEINRGTRTSLQFHNFKRETNYVLRGRIKLWYRDDSGKDCFVEMSSGDYVTIQPKAIHRVEAMQDTVLLEASTNHLTDVVRLQDDTNRGDGRIASEHGK